MSKRILLLLTLVALISACTPPKTTPTTVVPQPTSTSESPTPTVTEKPTATLEPEEPPQIEEPSLSVPSERGHHPYNWQPEDVKGLDPWGDSASDDTDIVAIYQRQNEGVLEFRLDLLDFQDDELEPIYFAIDFLEGGSIQVSPENSLAFEIEWDLLVSVIGGEFKLYDPSFTDISDQLVTTETNRQLDFIFFAIPEEAFADWDGAPFQIQALLLNSANSKVLDGTTPFATDGTTGRAKLILPFAAVFEGSTPGSTLHLYDGFAPFGGGESTDERLDVRRGYRYLLDAVEKYEIPLTQISVQINELPGGEYFRIHERYRHLASLGLFDPLTTLGYGHFMPMQPNDADAKAIEMAIEIREGLDIPVSDVFYAYEGMLTPGDIQVIKDAGFETIFAPSQAHYSFFGWIDDWANQAAINESIRLSRKIHQFNGMKFVFDTKSFFLGFDMDERWGEIDWGNEYDEYREFLGTDQGLKIWLRWVLHDMAMDPDQEQYYTLGSDLDFTAWGFQDAVEWNFQWLAGHPWIEVTTFSSIVNRGWEVIDHGELDVPPDEPLWRFQIEGDMFYNAYFRYHYYGGISDGHSPLIPAGAEIESYYDYVPYLRDGELIPSGRIMGDDKTPGSIVYETLANLRSAPDNPITTIAWLSYFNHIGEQAFHNGGALREMAKNQANFLGLVNKIVAAANWADEAAQGALTSETLVLEKDLDLDGEMEYVMHNDRVFAVFENDGGRLEYAFAYDPEYGPIQLIAPASQYFFKPDPRMGFDIQNGEATIPLGWPDRPDGAFVEDLDSDGQFEYEPLNASIEDQRLTFSYQTRPVVKTFTLQGDTMRVHYERGSSETLNLGFAPAVNQLGVFDKDWIWNFEPVEMEEVLGWQTTSGGSVLLNLEDNYIYDTASFFDSPAREEMQQREDDSTYPEGHWMCFPCSWIKIWDTDEVDFSLTLRAAPIDKSVYTPIPTPTPTSAPPTPGPTPSTEQINEGYVIYSDDFASGWDPGWWDSEALVDSTAMVYDGTQAIEVSVQQYGGIALLSEPPPDLSPYNWLVFYINIGETTDPVFVLDMYYKDAQVSIETLNVSDYVEGGQFEAGGWHQVVVPLSDLNPEGAIIDQINFTYYGSGAATFYLDEIRFVGTGP